MSAAVNLTTLEPLAKLGSMATTKCERCGGAVRAAAKARSHNVAMGFLCTFAYAAALCAAGAAAAVAGCGGPRVLDWAAAGVRRGGITSRTTAPDDCRRFVGRSVESRRSGIG